MAARDGAGPRVWPERGGAGCAWQNFVGLPIAFPREVLGSRASGPAFTPFGRAPPLELKEKWTWTGRILRGEGPLETILIGQ